MMNLPNPMIVAGVVLALSACAGKESADPAKPAVAERKSLMDRLSQEGGYKQDASGNWVPKSDKRSSFDSQRESAYFKGNIEKSDYKTGDFAKKAWWGNKEYGKDAYAGDTDGSRFHTTASQQGRKAGAEGRSANLAGSYATNSLDRTSAREGRNAEISRPLDSRIEGRRGVFQAPSVIDWREQREMSMDRSRGILGR